jgi:hypothetical protein
MAYVLYARVDIYLRPSKKAPAVTASIKSEPQALRDLEHLNYAASVGAPESVITSGFPT